MLDECFEQHTAGLIQHLKPDAVILSGTPSHRFESRVLAAAPSTWVLQTLHYAHREGGERQADELARIKRELGMIGFKESFVEIPVSHSQPLTPAHSGSGSSQLSKRSQGGSEQVSSAAVRAAEIARHLGMKSPSKVASGRYLREATGTIQINVVVFRRNNLDCVGLEGTGKMRQWVIQNDARWRKLGFQPHQPRPDSHKSSSTYIQECEPLPDGKVDLRLKQARQTILNMFEHGVL